MKNTPAGNPDLKITGFSTAGVLREDTLTIYGKGFDRIPYQNKILFPTSSVEEQWVNSNGEVTDSIVYRVLQYSTRAALVVDSDPDSIKVIVPTNAVYGSVLAVFGVDTATSSAPYNLLTTELRPRIGIFSPAIGSPGVPMRIQVFNGYLEPERMVIAFGEHSVSPEGVTDGELFLRVPDIFPGPVDLRIGKRLDNGDTLWSRPVNFGITPVRVAPFVLVTYDARLGGGGLIDGIVGYGETIAGSTNLVSLQGNFGNIETTAGIAYDNAKNRVYWISQSAGASAIVLGDITSKQAITKSLSVQRFNDIVFMKHNDQEYLYTTGNQIRRIKISNNFTVLSSHKIFPAGAPSSLSTDITNMKVSGSTFYWVDRSARAIVKGTLSPDSLSLVNVDTLYSDTDGLASPFGMAIHEPSNTMFISMQDGTDHKIMKGSLDGQSALELMQEYKDGQNSFYDLEIDIDKNYLYWANGNFDITYGGIYRVPLGNPTARPELVYQFALARYFEIRKENQ